MANALLYIVGNSDIKLNNHQRFGGFLDTTQIALDILKRNKERELTKSGFKFPGKDKILITIEIKGIKQTYDEELFFIELPIFVPIIQRVIQDCHAKPDRIYLFGTEQRLPHHQDTIYAARIIELFLNEKYRISSKNIAIEKIENSPFDYDQMADYFASFFSRNPTLRMNAFNYISLTAGTPAETTNLALRSMDLSVKYLYLSRDSKECEEVKLLSRLNREKYASIIRDLIENYEYGLALDIARESPFGSNFQLLTLLEVMRRRILFDFKGALKECRRIDTVDQVIRNLMNTLADLAQLDEKKLLEELVYRIELSFKKRDYLEGIALLFSIIDNLLQYKFQVATGKSIKKLDGEFNEFNQFVQEKPYIKDKEKYLNKPTRPNLRKLLSLISKDESPVEKIEEVNGFINKLERPKKIDGKEISVLDLRNNGPYAHGNMGITEELFTKIYPPYGANGIINDLKVCLMTSLNHLTELPFDTINTLLSGWLE